MEYFFFLFARACYFPEILNNEKQGNNLIMNAAAHRCKVDLKERCRSWCTWNSGYLVGTTFTRNRSSCRCLSSSGNNESLRNSWISLHPLDSTPSQSYFEIETQLLTFRKDILPYEFAYHLILQNRNGSRKVKGGDWGVKP